MSRLLPQVSIPMSRWLVYFIQAETGQIKIGRSTRIADRLLTLQQSSPVALKFVGWVPEHGRREIELHCTFAVDRLHGEWFRPSPRLIDLIERIRGQSPQQRNLIAKAIIGYPPPSDVVAELNKSESTQGGHNGGVSDE